MVHKSVPPLVDVVGLLVGWLVDQIMVEKVIDESVCWLISRSVRWLVS